MAMNIVVWIIFGALAGWIASVIMSTSREQGAVANIVVGIIGAVLGGFVVQKLGGTGVTGFNISSLVIAVFGSIILLAIVKTFSHY